MDGIASVGSSIEGASTSMNLDVTKRMALKNIDEFVHSFSDQQTFATAVASASPTALAQITEGARIPEAGHLRCRFHFFPGIFTFPYSNFVL